MTERYRNNTPDFQTHPVFAVAEFFLRNVIYIDKHLQEIKCLRRELHRLISWLEKEKSMSDAVRTGLNKMLRRENVPNEVNKYLNGFFYFSYGNSATLYIEITAKPSDLEDLSRPQGSSLLNERMQELRMAFYEEESFDNREQNRRDPSPELPGLPEPPTSHAQRMTTLLNNSAINVGPARVIKPNLDGPSNSSTERTTRSEDRPHFTDQTFPSSSIPLQPTTREMDTRTGMSPSTTSPFHQLPKSKKTEDLKKHFGKVFDITLGLDIISGKVSQERTCLVNAFHELPRPTVPHTLGHLIDLFQSKMNDVSSTQSNPDVKFSSMQLSTASRTIMHSAHKVTKDLVQLRAKPKEHGILENMMMSPPKHISSSTAGEMSILSFQYYPDQDAKVKDEFKPRTFNPSSPLASAIKTFTSTENKKIIGQVTTSSNSIQSIARIPEFNKPDMLPKPIGPLVFEISASGEIVPMTAPSALTEEIYSNQSKFSCGEPPFPGSRFKEDKIIGKCGICGLLIHDNHEIPRCKCCIMQFHVKCYVEYALWSPYCIGCQKLLLESRKHP